MVIVALTSVTFSVVRLTGVGAAVGAGVGAGVGAAVGVAAGDVVLASVDAVGVVVGGDWPPGALGAA